MAYHMWKYSWGAARNWSQKISTIFSLVAYADRTRNIASRRQVSWLGFFNILQVWRRFSRITDFMSICGLLHVKVLTWHCQKPASKVIYHFFLVAYVDRKWNIASRRQVLWLRSYSKIFQVRRGNGICATFFQRDDVLLAWHPFERHFICAPFPLRDLPVARRSNCATFQLRYIPSARQPVCATFFPHV